MNQIILFRASVKFDNVSTTEKSRGLRHLMILSFFGEKFIPVA